MMTIASIDTLPETTILDAAAMPGSAISAETVGAFQQALSGQLAENDNLGSVLREAMANVSATLVKVEAARPGSPEVVMPPAELVVAQNLSGQVTENVRLGEMLTAAMVVVGETLAKVKTAVPQTAMVRPVADADAPVAVASAAVRSLVQAAEPVVVQPAVGQEVDSMAVRPLPAQVTENVKLGETLTAATVVVGETLAKVETAVTQTATVRPVAGADAPVAVAPAAVRSVVQAAESVVVQSAVGREVDSMSVGPLPAQVTENVKLGETLTAATVIVGETLSKVGSAVTQPVAKTAAPVVTEHVADEIPEATADALVAAGAAPQAPVQAPAAVEALQAAAVAPVDVVRVQAAAAAEPVPSQVLVQAAEAVADTLLVTPGLLRGQGEVVVQLRPDVLDGTEVKIAVTGRQLEVVFQPQTVDTAVLLENCRTQLVQHLAAKIVSFNVSVDVRKRKS